MKKPGWLCYPGFYHDMKQVSHHFNIRSKLNGEGVSQNLENITTTPDSNLWNRFVSRHHALNCLINRGGTWTTGTELRLGDLRAFCSNYELLEHKNDQLVHIVDALALLNQREQVRELLSNRIQFGSHREVIFRNYTRELFKDQPYVFAIYADSIDHHMKMQISGLEEKEIKKDARMICKKNRHNIISEYCLLLATFQVMDEAVAFKLKNNSRFRLDFINFTEVDHVP